MAIDTVINTTPDAILVDAIRAAELLSISPRNLASLTKAGAVPSILLGHRRLYSPAALREWVSLGCQSQKHKVPR